MLKIYRPVTQPLVQNFGDNLPCCKLDTNGKPVIPYIVDVTTPNACPIGYTKYYPQVGIKAHNGKDFSAPLNTPLYLAVETEYPDMDWTILTESNDISGNMLVAVSTKPIAIPLPKETGSFGLIQREYMKLNGKLHVALRFAHLSYMITNGSTVKQGAYLGHTGASGRVSGPHVHEGLEIHSSDGLGFKIDTDNGYNGSIDPRPFFIDAYWFDREKLSLLTTLVATLKQLLSILKQPSRAV